MTQRGLNNADGVGFRQDRVHNTRAAGTIYRHQGDSIPLVGELEAGAIAPGVGAPVSLIGVTYGKRIGFQPATFALEIKAGTLDVYREIQNGDWVTFYWNRSGKLLHGTLGLVRAVRRSRSSVQGATRETWTLECQDWSRVLNKTQIWFDDYTAYETNVGGKILASRMNFNPGGSPDAIVLRILDAWLGLDGVVGGAWKMPKGLDDFGPAFIDGVFASVQGETPIPLLELLGQPGKLRGEMFDESALFQPNAGTMLAPFLQEWSHPMLNELWFDVGDGDLEPGGGFPPLASDPKRSAPVVFIREKPFVNSIQGINSPWFKLPTVRLSRSAALNSNVATNDDERVNLFQLNATPGSMINFEQYALSPPSYARSRADLHGIRKYEKISKFASFGGRSEGQNWVEELRIWHTLVSSWYGPNHLWLSGTIQVPFLLGEARVGKRLVIGEGEEREQYYIEGVNHNWRYPSRGNTQLTVTRGFIGPDEELVDTVVEERARYRRRGVKVADGLDPSGTTLNFGTALGLGEGEDVA